MNGAEATPSAGGENLFGLLFAAARGREQDPFLLPRGFDTAAPTSFEALAARSAAFAGVLREVGVVPGDRVFVQVEKSMDAFALYLACLRVGAVYGPLNTAYTAEEAAFFLGDARPRLFVLRPGAEGALAPMARGAGVETLYTLGTRGEGSLADRAAELAPFDDVVTRAGSDLAAMLYTSGTTGRPKGATLTHANLASNARALVRTWRMDARDVLLHALPIFHVHGLFVALHSAMLAGARVLFLPRFDAAAVRAALAEATVLMGVPTFYSRLLAEPDFGEGDCARARLFISGSAPMSEALFDAFRRRTGHTVLERYGMTETGILTSNPVAGDRVGGTVGFALPGVSLRVADAHDQPVAAGTKGAVQVRGENVFPGYWELPERTAAEFCADGFFRTGDIGSADLEGRLTLAGRESDMIISGGFNIYPKEIERCLDESPGVRESAVVGVPHADLGEGVVAYLVAEAGEGPSEASVRASLEGRLARFKQPRRIFFVDALPRNTMGKVQKKQLRERAAHCFEGP